MSYIVTVVVPPVPADLSDPWQFPERLRAAGGDEGPVAPVLRTLHDTITSVYPCLSSYADSDDGIDDCPWADGPLIDNFGTQMGTIGLTGGDKLKRVASFVRSCASTLGLTVFDEQEGKIGKPMLPSPRATYYVVIRGIAEGAVKEEVIRALMSALDFNEQQSHDIFNVKLAYVKKGIAYLDAIRYQEAISNAGGLSAFGPE
ncbi:hypothetical protein [Massilia sp. TWP1-3-3]|uniref:hypothetical protein n=1 Tax=Massilia sp. TWP1-3-3 TaxID=2804573 RepID=UPI003CEA73F9